MKKTALALLIIALLSILSIYIPISLGPLNRALIVLFEKRLDAKINCRSLRIYIWRALVAEGVEAFGKGGLALSADKVVINYDLVSPVTRRLHLICDLENVKFYKTSSIINSLSDMLHIQPLGNLTFSSVHADLHVGRDDTLTQNLSLTSDEIKIFGNAVTGRDNSIMCLLRLFLKNGVVEKIPKDIQDSLFLKKEEGPWSSIYIGVKGNYEKPILRIIAGRFRMNIVPK